MRADTLAARLAHGTGGAVLRKWTLIMVAFTDEPAFWEAIWPATMVARLAVAGSW